MSDDRIPGGVEVAPHGRVAVTREEVKRLIDMIGLFRVLSAQKQAAVIEWMKRNVVH